MKIVDIEKTPNPSTVKMVIDKALTVGGISKQYDSAKDLEDLNFLADVLENPIVQRVTVQGNWISITLSKKDWTLDDIKPIGNIIRQYDTTTFEPLSKAKTEPEDEDPRMVLIRQVLEQEVLPYLGSHGGGLEIDRLENNVLYVRYMGACGGCPASMSGTLLGIENLLQLEVDPKIKVQPVAI